MQRKGFIARRVKIQAHTYGNRPANSQVPEEWYELTKGECETMTPRLPGKPIYHWHNRAHPGLPPQVLGHVEAAAYDAKTGDWGVTFRLNQLGEEAMKAAGETSFGLSLSHMPSSLQPSEVSLTFEPARAGSEIVPSNDVRYNDPVFGKLFAKLSILSHLPHE